VAGAPHQILPLDELDRVELAAVVSPLPTALEAIRDVVRDRSPAVLPVSRRDLLRRRLGARELAALAPFANPGVPEQAAGQPNEAAEPSAGATMAEEIDRIEATDPHRLAGRIADATARGRPTGPWRPVQERPAAWLRDYALALRRLWTEVEPLWLGAAGALDRESERIEATLARCAGRQIAATPGMPGRVLRGHWLLASHNGRSGRLRPAARVQLVPLVGTATAAGWSDDNDDVLLSVRYALPRGRAAGPGSLDALLGHRRSALLQALDRPLGAGALADRLFLVPSALTHHLDALEAAGLLTRSRDGRRVTVARTLRAEALLALYDA
jgi:DNA-binding transcriptional ArsR family regulator